MQKKTDEVLRKIKIHTQIPRYGIWFGMQTAGT